MTNSTLLGFFCNNLRKVALRQPPPTRGALWPTDGSSEALRDSEKDRGPPAGSEGAEDKRPSAATATDLPASPRPQLIPLRVLRAAQVAALNTQDGIG